ncbi:MAG: hypothetical protein CMJ18_17410 [Phycisphaeraceae bacterium]|nr:hypothetical protein [Phycisphaeraceae bacterium]
MRIGIISLMHESNTFISAPTTLEDFRRDALLTGDAVIEHWRPTVHEIGGFIEGIEAAGFEPVPIASAWAMPKGSVTRDAYETILNLITHELDHAGRLDGLLVAPHGAGVCEAHHDMDGHWLSVVRDRIGPDVPMVCTLDAHVNLSRRMIDACDATVIYRTNPHTDQHQVGLQAADLIARTLRGEIRPTQAASFPPVAINIERQTTADEPCRSMYAVADAMLERPGVLSNSIGLGFAYADVEEMGTSFLVVTDGDRDLAQRCADELAVHLWTRREEFVAKLTGVDEAIDQALAAEGRVCLLDMGDNVGGGSSADGTFLARALHERSIGESFVCICDPESVQKAEAAGVGARVDLSVGGRTDDLHGAPLDLTATVRLFHNGEFIETKVRHGGRREAHMGRTAIVETDDGMTVQLTSLRMAPFSLEQVRCCVDPTSFRILVAKGVVAPMAAYEEVCDTFIRVNTRGVSTADLSALDFKYRRRPLFPFEPVEKPGA